MTETEKYLITKFWLITSKMLGLTKAPRNDPSVSEGLKKESLLCADSLKSAIEV